MTRVRKVLVLGYLGWRGGAPPLSLPLSLSPSHSLSLSPCFPKYLPHYADHTCAHAAGECGAHKSDKLQSIKRCAHTEMETIERQWHEVIALINSLCPWSLLLNHQWCIVGTVRAFCFFTLMGCFDQRLFGDPALLPRTQSPGKRN